MKKYIFVLIGLVLGLLCGELLRYKKLQRLKALEEKEARRKAYFDRDKQEWEAELAAMPFEERMDWELFEASLKQANYQPNWDDDHAEDDYAVET